MEFCTYNEQYLNNQVKLVRKVTNDWKNFSYPDVQRLKSIYSKETFTPDTRHYLFDDDNLVGFLSSAVEGIEGGILYGSIQYPFVDVSDITKRIELQKDLMDRAKSTLKKKGVSVIRSIFNESWPVNSVRALYDSANNLQRVAEIPNFHELASDNVSPSIVEFNSVQHMDAFHKGVTLQFPDMTFNQMEEILASAHETKGFVNRYVVVEQNMVIAQGRITVYDDTANLVIFSYHVNGAKYKEGIIRKLLFNMNKDYTVKAVNLVHTYLDAVPEEGFDNLNLKFEKAIRYEMKL